MNVTISPRLPSDLIDPPAPPPPDPAVLRVAQLAGISLPHAAIIAELAGIGRFARRAGR